MLVRAKRDGRTLAFDYEITDPRITRAVAAGEFERTKTQACSHVTTEGLLREGGALRRTYSFASGDPPLSVELRPGDCGR